MLFRAAMLALGWGIAAAQEEAIKTSQFLESEGLEGSAVVSGSQNAIKVQNISPDGHENRAQAQYSQISGGRANLITGSYAHIGGGAMNLVISNYAHVTGGFQNTASGRFATVLGGSSNTARGRFSLAVGQKAVAVGANSAAFSFGKGSICKAAQDGEFRICAKKIVLDAENIITTGESSGVGGGGTAILAQNLAIEGATSDIKELSNLIAANANANAANAVSINQLKGMSESVKKLNGMKADKTELAKKVDKSVTDDLQKQIAQLKSSKRDFRRNFVPLDLKKGDKGKFYPLAFQDGCWSDGRTEIMIHRTNVHTDTTWAGAMIFNIRFHATNWGHGADWWETHYTYNKNGFVGKFQVPSIGAGVIIWLQGGYTYYAYNDCAENAGLKWNGPDNLDADGGKLTPYHKSQTFAPITKIESMVRRGQYNNIGYATAGEMVAKNTYELSKMGTQEQLAQKRDFRRKFIATSLAKGSKDKFYPLAFADGCWSDGRTEIMIHRTNVHTDTTWAGAMIFNIRFHATNWGHGADWWETHYTYNKQGFVGNFQVPSIGAGVIIWLRGGYTYYVYNECAANAGLKWNGPDNLESGIAPYHASQKFSPITTISSNVKRGHFNSLGLITTGLISGSLIRTRSFRAFDFKKGSTSKFYPIAFQDACWSDGRTEIMIHRTNVHTDKSWAGAMIFNIKFHATNWGHGADYWDTHYTYNRQGFIGNFQVPSIGAGVIIWLRGGYTYYAYNDCKDIHDDTGVKWRGASDLTGDSGCLRGPYHSSQSFCPVTSISGIVKRGRTSNLKWQNA